MDNLESKIDDLIGRVDDLIDVAGQLTPRVDEMERAARRDRLVIAWLCVLMVAGGLVGLSGWSTASRLDGVVQRSLCPLYGLLLGSENPRSREAYPDGPDAYDAAFAVLRDAWSELRCSTD